jgi:Xaa-Pro aminopeptidase
MTEFSQKQVRTQRLLEEHRLDDLLLQRASRFAWATCGAASYVNTAVTYAEAGFPGEWRLHHQGSPAGYELREHVATTDSADTVSAGQVYAWNPSITGTKSEDTILVGRQRNQVFTSRKDWPVLSVPVGDQEIVRPAILEIP